MTQAICFKDIMTHPDKQEVKRLFKLALSCIDLIKEIDINAITPELGYFYSMKFGDEQLCPQRKDLPGKYAEFYKKEIQLDICLNTVEMIYVLAEPFLMEYKYPNTYRTITITKGIRDSLYRLNKNYKFHSSDIYGELKTLSSLIWDISVKPSLSMYKEIYPQSGYVLNIADISDIFTAMLGLRTYNTEEPDDIAALFEYMQPRNLDQITTVLKIMYRLFDHNNDLKWIDDPNSMQKEIINYISSITFRVPEVIINIRSLQPANVYSSEYPNRPYLNYNVVDNYLSALYKYYNFI